MTSARRNFSKINIHPQKLALTERGKKPKQKANPKQKKPKPQNIGPKNMKLETRSFSPQVWMGRVAPAGLGDGWHSLPAWGQKEWQGCKAGGHCICAGGQSLSGSACASSSNLWRRGAAGRRKRSQQWNAGKNYETKLQGKKYEKHLIFEINEGELFDLVILPLKEKNGLKSFCRLFFKKSPMQPQENNVQKHAK